LDDGDQVLSVKVGLIPFNHRSSSRSCDRQPSSAVTTSTELQSRQ